MPCRSFILALACATIAVVHSDQVQHNLHVPTLLLQSNSPDENNVLPIEETIESKPNKSQTTIFRSLNEGETTVEVEYEEICEFVFMH